MSRATPVIASHTGSVAKLSGCQKFVLTCLLLESVCGGLYNLLLIVTRVRQ
jgi:hypothetical protein